MNNRIVIEKFCKILPIIYNQKITDLCKKPYYGHSKGCPNYGKRDICPPKMKLVNEILDMNKNIYTIGIKFDLSNHFFKMRKNHPEWTERQVKNCLYYQKGMKNDLYKYVKNVIEINDKLIIYKPEACGINLIKMLKKENIFIKFPIDDSVWFFVIVGYPKRCK